MPPKSKAVPKPKEDKAKVAAPAAPPPPPRTVNERSQQRFQATRPLDKALKEVGISGLSTSERQAWASSQFVRSSSSAASGSGGSKRQLSNKAQKDTWRAFNDANLPIRSLKKPSSWGKDHLGRDLGELSPEQFRARTDRRILLTALTAAHRAFLDKRARAESGALDPDTGSPFALADEDVEEERTRRREMAALRQELYGQISASFANDPAWDDVDPIPLDEPEGALAAISYPDEYAEAISYLRAVMANKEYSPRCLKLTEHVISMNPAHYTVWLYRFSIITALNLPIPDEIEWLNGVALEHLKNYQIWHHRHLLLEAYHPTISSNADDEVSRLVRSERAFITTMLAEDTKNYHVWSYRQFLVRLLGCWSDPEELKSIEKLLDDDVRNNSAWSHRFFLVFTDPAHTTPDSHATERDEKVPEEIIDREVRYAKEKILLAPQNQSPWNYLRGVLVKGGRALAEVEGFVGGLVSGVVGDGEEEEEVKSSHALDLLAEIYAEKGDVDKAVVCLDRLGQRWDRVRKGYWDWRKGVLMAAASAKA